MGLLRGSICALCAVIILWSGSVKGEDPEYISVDIATTQAIKNSTTMAGLIGRAKVSEKLIFEKWRTFLPDLAIRYQKDDTVIYRSDDYRNQSATIDFGYDLNTNGKSVLEYKISGLDKVIAMSEIVIERNNIILQVRSKYYELLRLKDEIEVNKKLRDSLKLNKKFGEEEKRLGFSTKLALTQIEAKLSESEYSVKKSENDYYNKLKDFKAYIGFEFKSELKSIDDFEFNDEMVPQKKDEELLSIALKNRLELKKSELTLLKTKYNMKLAKFYYLPKFRLEGSVGTTGPTFPPNNFTWNIGVKVDTSIFGSGLSAKQTVGESDGGYTRNAGTQARLGILDDVSVLSRITSTEAAYSESENSHRMLINSIKLEVIRSYKNFFETKERLKIAKENAALYEEQLKIESEKVRLGETTMKDYLDATVELSKANLRVLAAKCELKISAAAYENNIGIINFNGGK